MRRHWIRFLPLIVCSAGAALFVLPRIQAQFGRSTEWVTTGYDAQRSSWLRTDAKISPTSMAKPGAFEFLWKMKLDNKPRGANALTEAVILDRLIGYKGFRALVFIGGSSDKVFTIDSDLGRMEWQKQLPSSSAGNGQCTGGLTSGLARPTVASIIPPPGVNISSGGGGRGTAAKSGVGEPMQGAVTLGMRPAQRQNFTAAAPSRPVSGPASANNRPPRPTRTAGFGASNQVYTLGGDGTLYSLNTANGADFEPPVKFVPPGANAYGLVVVDSVAYVSTAGGCGGAADGIWAVDLLDKKVSTWKADGGGAGSAGPAFGPDGTVYVATRNGTIAALEPVDLKPIQSYKTQASGYGSSPVIFEMGQKVLLAVATSDGKIEILDTANLKGSPAAVSSALLTAGTGGPSALSSWQDPAGTRWILAAEQATVVAFKVVDQGGSVSVQRGWKSRDLTAPATPMIVNGVIFALATGENRDLNRSVPAVLYALDGTSGKELWNSGKTMTSFVHGATLSGGASQIYATTHDGTLYVFGFPIEH